MFSWKSHFRLNIIRQLINNSWKKHNWIMEKRFSLAFNTAMPKVILWTCFLIEAWTKMFILFSSLQLPEKIQPAVSTHQNLWQSSEKVCRGACQFPPETPSPCLQGQQNQIIGYYDIVSMTVISFFNNTHRTSDLNLDTCVEIGNGQNTEKDKHLEF